MALDRPLRVGIGGTLLALAEGRTIVRALRGADPGLQVELLTIAARGDPARLAPAAGGSRRNPPSGDLDAALRSGEVDCCVRALAHVPAGGRHDLRTAAIPLREDPRDVVVFRAGILDRLRSGAAIRIGSSSVRHDQRTARFLGHLLPVIGPDRPDLRLVSLRGTVQEKLGRLGLVESDAAGLDGLILAIAGLNRLWSDRDGHAAIAPAIEGTRVMVLPLSACPTAPAQGALAIECRHDDQASRATLAVINDPASARRVRRELELRAAQPESERSRFTATSVRSENCGTVIFMRGVRRDNDFARTLWNRPARPEAATAWDGGDWVRQTEYQPRRSAAVTTAPAAFIAHWRALDGNARLPAMTRVWVSGVASWKRLAGLGVWVEGCADNLGFASIADTLASPVLRLPPLSAWSVLTRADTIASWQDTGVGSVIPAYSIGAPTDQRALDDIRQTIRGRHISTGAAPRNSSPCATASRRSRTMPAARARLTRRCSQRAWKTCRHSLPGKSGAGG